MEYDSNKYKTKLTEMLKDVNDELEGLEASSQSKDEFRDSDNVMEDDYKESEEGFRSGEISMDLVQKKAKITAALSRIEEGTYGIDTTTGEKISPDRLDAVPYAEHTIENAKKLEE